jgi:hypothetical protein
MIWLEHIARTGEMRNTYWYKMLAKSLKGTDYLLGRPSRRKKNIIKMDLNEIR